MEPVRRLQGALARREAIRAEALRHLAVLERELATTRSQLDTVETEIQGTRTFAAFLIGDILDRVRSEHGEAWTPFPISGYRIWRIEKTSCMAHKCHGRHPHMSQGVLGTFQETMSPILRPPAGRQPAVCTSPSWNSPRIRTSLG